MDLHILFNNFKNGKFKKAEVEHRANNIHPGGVLPVYMWTVSKIKKLNPKVNLRMEKTVVAKVIYSELKGISKLKIFLQIPGPRFLADIYTCITYYVCICPICISRQVHFIIMRV